MGSRGGGRGGKIMMIDFGKRRGESIILFAEKEFKPEGRGRGRGGRIIIFLQGRGGVNIIVWVRGGLTGKGREGKIMMIDFGKRRGESIILFAEKEFKPEGRGRGRGRIIIICFCKARGGGASFFWREWSHWKAAGGLEGIGRAERVAKGKWAGGEGGRGGDYYYFFVFCGGGRVIIIISAS